jgi:phosphoglycolate phosphatase-like HAD superfamily hydrolase
MSTTDAWLKLRDLSVLARLGHTRHALFDFDGTLSLLRQGWETVMHPMMVEAICGASASTPEIEQLVGDYVDRSTGILTILQMEWLAETVRQRGMVPNPLSAREYKAIYLERLMASVGRRIDQVAQGQVAPDERMVPGAREFVAGLRSRGVRLYLASGTDHADVAREAALLGMADFFEQRIYGALDHSQATHSKERVIQRILDENGLAGDELLVAGDGPVEIREAHARRALALGVATDEVSRSGWNPHKVERLTAAGADLLVPDFSHAQDLLGMLIN